MDRVLDIKEHISSQDGFILWEVIILSLAVISLIGCSYFFQVNKQYFTSCKAQIIASFNIDMYLDRIAVLHYSPKNEIFYSNGIEFQVEEKCIDNTAMVKISWKLNGNEYNVTQERICKN